MEGGRVTKGAWRRSPVLPRALTAQGGATVTAGPPWTEAPEARRAPGTLSGSASDERFAPGFDVTPGDEPRPGVRVRTGGCLCGAVRYEAHGEPKVVGLCHCADCRKATGGYALHFADWAVGDVRIQGELSTFGGRSFCPRCGSRVVHFSAHHTEVLLGTLDDPPNDLTPQREIWTVRREPWLTPVAGAEQFERDPA